MVSTLMKKVKIMLIVLLLLLASTSMYLGLTLSANAPGTVFMGSDGNEPSDAPVQQDGNKYVLTRDASNSTLTSALVYSTISQSQKSQTATQVLAASGIISAFRFSKEIAWLDGANELVQISSDNCFVLNGTIRKIVGFVFGTGTLNDDSWSLNSTQLMNKEFQYLSQNGVRLVDVNMGWGFWLWPRNYPERITGVLDVAFKNKMLVCVELNDHFNSGFDCSINREILPGRTYSQWFNDFWSVAGKYSNIVAISLENEIDEDARFSSQQIQPYMEWLCDMVKTSTHLLVYSKLVPYFGNGDENSRKITILNITDIPCIDPYASSVTDMNSKCAAWTKFLADNGKNDTSWWIGETNKMDHEPPDWNVDTPNYTIDYLKAVLDSGAQLATLYVMNYPAKPTWAFFDIKGTPVPSLETMSDKFNDLQK